MFCLEAPAWKRAGGWFGENTEQNRALRLLKYAPLASFRSGFALPAEYLASCTSSLENYLPMKSYFDIRHMLNQEGLDITSMQKRLGRLTPLAEILGVGLIENKKDARVGVVGVCLPERINLQTLLPLIVAKDLLEKDKLKKLYVALPVGAYAAAGLPKYTQYKQVVGLVEKMFKDRLGDDVLVMPDYKLSNLRMAISLLAGRFISDRFARHKYPYGNLFAYTEVAGYSADIALPAIVEQEDVLVVAEYMQYESLHAGAKAVKVFGFNMAGLILPLLSPQIKDNQLVHISHLNESFDDSTKPLSCLETSSVFLAAQLFLSFNEAVGMYQQFVTGTSLPNDLPGRVRYLQAQVADTRPIPDADLVKIENHCVTKFKEAERLLDDDLQKRMKTKEPK
jgi:hypothetical protein